MSSTVAIALVILALDFLVGSLYGYKYKEDEDRPSSYEGTTPVPAILALIILVGSLGAFFALKMNGQ